MIRKPTSILVTILAAGFALLPALVEAKAGRGGGMGSRGMRTYDAAPATPTAPSAAPVQRTVTPPPPTQTQPQAAPRPATTAGAPAAAQPGFFNRPFMPALMGGLIGMGIGGLLRSEEHTSELQSLMRISYAVFCLKKKKKRLLTP